MGKRLLAAAIGVPLVLLFVFFSKSFPILIDIAVAIICFMCVGEFCAATGRLKYWQLSIPSLLYAVMFPLLYFSPVSLLLRYLYSGIMLSMLIFFHKKITFRSFAYVYSITIVVTYSMTAIINMRLLEPELGSFYFVLSLGLPWMADIGAFFAGSYFGKHKLCPEISPKKTVEGAVGGVILCMGATCLIALIFNALLYNNSADINYLALVTMAFLGSFVSILGDLSFSVIKRYFKIKDYGFIIPGHGGFLDRFDSVVFVSPFIYIFTKFYTIIFYPPFYL